MYRILLRIRFAFFVFWMSFSHGKKRLKSFISILRTSAAAMIWYDKISYHMIWNHMIWYDVIWYIIWYNMTSYDSISYHMISYDAIWYDIIWHHMIWYDIIGIHMVFYHMTWYHIIWYDIMLYDIITCSIMSYDMIWPDKIHVFYMFRTCSEKVWRFKSEVFQKHMWPLGYVLASSLASKTWSENKKVDYLSKNTVLLRRSRILFEVACTENKIHSSDLASIYAFFHFSYFRICPP